MDTKILGTDKKVSKAFRLFVDYDRSIEDGVKAGKYKFANHDIVRENWISEVGEVGKKERFFVLYCFGRTIRSHAVIEEIKRDGRTPGTIKDLLAIGELLPELQKQSPIIALGSLFGHPSEYKEVGQLTSDHWGRKLFLYWDRTNWDGRCQFLAMNKS